MTTQNCEWMQFCYWACIMCCLFSQHCFKQAQEKTCLDMSSVLSCFLTGPMLNIENCISKLYFEFAISWAQHFSSFDIKLPRPSHLDMRSQFLRDQEFLTCSWKNLSGHRGEHEHDEDLSFLSANKTDSYEYALAITCQYSSFSF